MQEIRRNIWSKRSLFLVVFVASIILLVCYLEGSWKTYLSFDNATDIPIEIENSYDRWILKHSNGNVFKLWHESLYTFRVVLPILLTVHYLYTYITEKITHYRYYQLVRKTFNTYLIDKIIGILFGTVISIMIGQMIAFGVIYLFSSHEVHIDVMQNIVSGPYETLFLNTPYVFWLMQIIVQIGYMFAFLIFSIGIASFFKNHLYLYILPFMIHTFISVVMPMPYKLTTIADMFNSEFRLENYLIAIAILSIVGIMMLIYNEKRWCQYG